MNAIPLTAVRRAGNRVHEPRDVDPLTKRAAELTAELVSRRLGIARPRIRWLPPAADVRGETLPVNLGEVWVKAGQSRAATIETVAHECRHAWQLEDGKYRWTIRGLETMTERERDAQEFGLAIRAELIGG